MRNARLALGLGSLLALGCTGMLEDGVLGPRGSGRSGTPGDDAGTVACERTSCTPLATTDTTPAGASALPRLGGADWERSARTALHLDEGSCPVSIPSAAPLRDGIGTMPSTSTVNAAVATEVAVAAETLAACATQPGAIDQLVSASDRDDATGGTWIDAFVSDLFRRPITGEEHAELVTLFAHGAGYYHSGNAFDDGVRVVVEAMLQSPSFGYRVEVGASTTLDATELASRLALGLWGTGPDAMLTEAARDGMLDDPAGLAVEVDRLMADARFQRTVERFHAWMLFGNRWHEMPDYGDPITADAIEEDRLFVDDIAFEERAGLSRLLTATHSFVNARLASRYGVSGSFTDATFTRTDLAPAGRAGLLTHVGFLISTGNGHPLTAPIHRGVRVGRRWLCEEFGAMANLPTMDDTSSTRRVSIETRTSSCGGDCHVPIINPLGMAFEHFGNDGAFRMVDDAFGHAAPIDSNVTFDFGARPSIARGPGAELRMLDGAVALETAMADTERAHDCYARNWISYLLARDATVPDSAWARSLGHRSFTTELPIVDLVRAIVTSPEFRTRPSQP